MDKEGLINLIREAEKLIAEALPTGGSLVKEQLFFWVLNQLQHNEMVKPERRRPKEYCPYADNFRYERGALVADCKVKKANCGIAILAMGRFSSCDHYLFEQDRIGKKLENLWRGEVQ